MESFSLEEVMESTEDKVILDVPYLEKDKAKELGAWWDPYQRTWYVPKGKDPKPFAKWFPKKEVTTEEDGPNG